MWKVKITSTKEDLLKSLDSIEINALFTDGVSEIVKSYKVWVDEVTTIDTDTILKQIILDRDRLNKMEEIKAVLIEQLNKEL